MIPSNLKFVLDSTPMEVADWLENNFTYEIPFKLETADDMEHASDLISAIMNSYTFITNLVAKIDIETSNLKNACPIKPDDKASEEDKKNYLRAKGQYVVMSQKKKILELRRDVLGKEYSGLSRMITIKQNIDQELHMSDIR